MEILKVVGLEAENQTLKEDIEKLRQRVRELQKENLALRQRMKAQYRHDQDYLAYEEDDRR